MQTRVYVLRFEYTCQSSCPHCVICATMLLAFCKLLIEITYYNLIRYSLLFSVSIHNDACVGGRNIGKFFRELFLQVISMLHSWNAKKTAFTYLKFGLHVLCSTFLYKLPVPFREALIAAFWLSLEMHPRTLTFRLACSPHLGRKTIKRRYFCALTFVRT